jgi:Tol biopolymer transport system component/predicted Ser/Thr protein kinase
LTSQRWRQIEELYHSARECGRTALDGADAEIRAEVEKLLAQDSESGGKLLDQGVADLISGLDGTAITTGTRLGPYKIEATLGHGGMGKVFRATDTRLNRPVAIKICKEEFSGRFEQESRSIAAINHPNVCTLYDVGPNYLVMELVEGETLAARLKRGKLPIDQTIRLGAQIAEALAVAHAKGIVHRDLKPGNIMLTKSGVKVLDFGLARSAEDPSLTAAGGVMGTPAYLAPERLEGKGADARTDIYALGLVLSEMASGRRSQSSEDLPPALQHVVKRCLETDPDDRWQNARDLKWELESIPRVPAAASSRSRNAMIAAALGLVTLLAVALAAVYFRQKPPSQPVTQVNLLLPEKARVRSLAVSPDGRAVAMVLVKDGKQQIWVRSLDALEATPLAGTDNAADPFWSPDSRTIAFFADARLKKIDRSGGPVETLCDALGVLGGTWNRNGDILMGGLSRVLRVSAAGGAVSNLPGHAAVTETYPVFLPDGRHFVATRSDWTDPTQDGIWLSSIDSGETRRILPDVSNAEIAGPPRGSSIGAVLFTRANSLMALPFEMKRLQTAGEPFPVAQGTASGINGAMGVSGRWLASASNRGVLAYVSGQPGSWQYVWRDRQGKELGVFGHAGADVTISPDGKALVGNPDGNITALEFAGGVTTRIAFRPHGGMDPIWSPDGRYVAYRNGNGTAICRKRVNGAGAEEVLLRTKTLAVPKSWSPDGRYIIYAQIDPGTAADLFALPVEPVEADPHPLVLARTKANEDQGQFSPDGHWVAYTSNESGLSEIYVIPFPPTPNGGKWMVSRGGGVMPRWRRDGKELFYISEDWKMMEVKVSTGRVFQSGTPHPLFETQMVDTGIRTGPISWDIAPGGDRFLIINENAADNSSLNVILNWRPSQE